MQLTNRAGRVLVLMCAATVLGACAGTAPTAVARDSGSAPVSGAGSAPAPESAVPSSTFDQATDSAGYVEATCGPESATDVLKIWAASGSIVVGRISLTGQTATQSDGFATLSEVRVDVVTRVAGADRGDSFTGWIYGGVNGEGLATRTSPELTASWSPQGTALILASDRSDAVPGSYVAALPVVDDQVMFSNLGCWDVADLPTIATTVHRQYLDVGDLVTDTVPAKAYPVADLAALIAAK